MSDQDALGLFDQRIEANAQMPSLAGYEALVTALRAYLDEFYYIDISDAEDVPKLAAWLAALAAVPREPHPGEPHDFRTTCLRCGEPGYLHVALIAPDERVDVAPVKQNTKETA